MNVHIQIYVTAKFDGLHHWPEAPDEVSFLRNVHRHQFHVKVWKTVEHDNRDTEFFILQSQLHEVLAEHIPTCSTWSCERMAREILKHMPVDQVEVSEDGENGAVLTRMPPTAEEHLESNSVLNRPAMTGMFTGTEVEGPFRGAPALFVPGSFGSVEAIVAAAETFRHKHADEEFVVLYLGAADDRQYTTLGVRRMLSFAEEYVGASPEVRLCVEVDAVTDIKHTNSGIPTIMQRFKPELDDGKFTLIYFDETCLHRIMTPPRHSIFHKTIDGPMIIWKNAATGKEYHAEVTDPLFKQDTML